MLGEHNASINKIQGRRRWGGWGGSGRPSFSLLSASAHARIISLAVALKYVVSKDSYRVALSICSSEKRGIRRLRDREAACVYRRNYIH